MDRMDIFHKFFQVARREQLHSAPLTPNYDGPRILDLGCGTGIWAIDMADKYQHAEVMGMDISLIQPNTIPPNLSFRRRNIESPWHGMALDSWDLIHMRMLYGSISEWNELYAKVFRHLKPGYGWMEQVELDLQPRCDDGTVLPDSKLVQWARYLADASERAYKPLLPNPNTRQMLQALQFVDIAEQVIRVPFNPWPADPHQKDIGRWFNLGLVQGLEAFSLGPLTRVFGWKKSDVDRLVADAKVEICSKKYHVYCEM
ncbi:MAG: hypothetical protein M1818_008244 [Claussenomyces sp. TS43310]|nr:MAG: hypothetical protein M1818_008244 [Claussenomyces sp. TS43310]